MVRVVDLRKIVTLEITYPHQSGPKELNHFELWDMDRVVILGTFTPQSLKHDDYISVVEVAVSPHCVNFEARARLKDASWRYAGHTILRTEEEPTEEVTPPGPRKTYASSETLGKEILDKLGVPIEDCRKATIVIEAGKNIEIETAGIRVSRSGYEDLNFTTKFSLVLEEEDGEAFRNWGCRNCKIYRAMSSPPQRIG